MLEAVTSEPSEFRWLGLLRPYRAALFGVGVCVLAQTALYVALPMSFEVLIDKAILKHDRHAMVTVLSLLTIAVAVGGVAGLWQVWLSARIVAGLMRDLRVRMFWQLQQLSLTFYDRTPAGDVITRFTGDLGTVEEICASIIPWVVLPSLLVLSSTVLLFILDWRLALLAMLVWPVALLGPRWSAPRAINASHSKRDAEATVADLVQESVSAQQTARVFNLSDRLVQGFGRQAAELAVRTERLHFYSALVERLSTIGNMALQVIVLGIGVALAFWGELSIGALAAFQSLFLLLSEQLGYVMQYTPNAVRAAGSLRRISSLLHEPPGSADAGSVTDPVPFERDLTLEHVTFAYDGRAAALTDVSLVVERGQFVALVGSSGCGKSTVLGLIMRLYDPQRGAIRVDGRDVRDLRQSAWRANLSPVMQDTFLFDTSIRENIRMGRLDATNEEIEAAARAAEIDDVIRRMPEGYETRVGQRGSRLSGGQRQRISIARAVLRNPAILILDEATSALDASTEAAINQTLARLAHDRTVISATHRLASVVSADRIFVFNEGRLVEQGGHEDLLSKEGVYAGLWKKQAGFGVIGDGEGITVRAERLRSIPLLSQLADEALSKLVPRFDSGRFGEDSIIVQEGDPGDRFYLVVRGKLEVYSDAGGGTRRSLGLLSDGDFFGEIALLRSLPRTASVRTLTPSVLLSLSRRSFLEVLADTPGLRDSLERAAIERI